MSTKKDTYHVSARGPASLGDLVSRTLQSRKNRGMKCSTNSLICEKVSTGCREELRKHPFPEDKPAKAPRQTPARQAIPA